MARIYRTLKRELLDCDEQLAACSDAAFRLYTTIVLQADDAGRLRVLPAQLGAATWWGHASRPDVEALLDELARAGVIRRYGFAREYLEILGWSEPGHPRYQRIDRPTKSHLPAPADLPPQITLPGVTLANAREDSGGLAKAREDSRGLAPEWKGREGIGSGSEKKLNGLDPPRARAIPGAGPGPAAGAQPGQDRPTEAELAELQARLLAVASPRGGVA